MVTAYGDPLPHRSHRGQEIREKVTRKLGMFPSYPPSTEGDKLERERERMSIFTYFQEIYILEREYRDGVRYVKYKCKQMEGGKAWRIISRERKSL